MFGLKSRVFLLKLQLQNVWLFMNIQYNFVRKSAALYSKNYNFGKKITHLLKNKKKISEKSNEII